MCPIEARSSPPLPGRILISWRLRVPRGRAVDVIAITIHGLGKSIGTEALQASAESFAHADFEAVVPGAAGGFNQIQGLWRNSLHWNAQSNIGYCVCRRSANGIFRRGRKGLIQGTESQQMCATSAGITSLKEPIPCEFNLPVQSILLDDRRTQIWRHSVNRDVGRRRICGEVGEEAGGWKRFRKGMSKCS